jgi:hypothetical protein
MITKAQWLAFCAREGDVDEHPFLELGGLGTLCEMEREGFVVRVRLAGNRHLIRITDKGRDALKELKAMPPKENA